MMVGTPSFSKFIRIADPDTGEDEIIFKHDWVGGTELRLPITSAVAELAGVSPAWVETELRTSVESDALERVFEPLADGTPRNGSQLKLLVASCEVSIQSNGWVEVKHIGG